MPTDALIIDAVRSPIGRRNGTLSHIRGDEVSAQVVNGLLGRNGVDPAEIEDLQWGCVTQIEEQAWNIGRNVALTAGWPVSVCGTTVDRQCGSSMQTNFNAAAAVWSGQLDLVISGGVEMMSRVPMGSNRGSMSDLVHEPRTSRTCARRARSTRAASRRRSSRSTSTSPRSPGRRCS
jgi:acetyl-CoA acyltransferase